MNEVVLVNEENFNDFVTEVKHIESIVDIAKDCINVQDCIKESLKSLDRHIGKIKFLLKNEDKY